MSGFYNALFQTNPNKDFLLEVLHFDLKEKPECLGRFRDIALMPNGEMIVLITRNGGGNRKQYQYVFDDFKKLHPYFIKDYDDPFDNTYAYAFFSVPKEHQAKCIELAKQGNTFVTVGERTKQAVKDMEEGKDTEVTRRMRIVGQTLIESLEGTPTEILVEEETGNL